MNRDCSKDAGRIAVSGVGMVSPLGMNADTTWTRLLAGHTAIRQFLPMLCNGEARRGPLPTLPTVPLHYELNGWDGTAINIQNGNGAARRGEESPPLLAAPVLDFSPNGARSRMGDFALMAAKEALCNAGFDLEKIRGEAVGCAVSQSKPVLTSDCGGRALDPALIMASFTGWSSESVVRRSLGLAGPAQNVAAACATGIAAIQTGAHWIREGKCHVALAGAAESSLHPLYIAGFRNMGALCAGRSAQDVKPFDADRSGFAMGEGAAVLVLESAESLAKRGGTPLAWLHGAQMMNNPADSIRFDADGASVENIIRKTLACRHSRESGNPGRKPVFQQQVDSLDSRFRGNDGRFVPDYINAHGTATLINDLQEARGIKRAFGPGARRVAVSSTKAATGHLLGAAGAIEAAFTVLALRDRIVPPTLHLNRVDPEFDLDFVPHTARKMNLDSALSLSYGFGGQMGAVLFGRA